jgi:hypothetical protein
MNEDPKRRWSFSLRTMFVVVTVLASVCLVAPPASKVVYRRFFESRAARQQRKFLERQERKLRDGDPSEIFEAPEVDGQLGPPIA